MAKVDFDEVADVIEFLYEKLNKVSWILIGSSSLIIRGVKVPAKKDIDIIISSADCKKVDGLLKMYRIQEPVFCGTKVYKSCYGVYEVNGVKIDMMGDFQYKMQNGRWSKVPDLSNYEIVEYKGMNLKVLSLEQELFEYEQTNRVDKVRKIKEKLGKK